LPYALDTIPEKPSMAGMELPIPLNAKSHQAAKIENGTKLT
jgi:hypothetical protein